MLASYKFLIFITCDECVIYVYSSMEPFLCFMFLLCDPNRQTAAVLYIGSSWNIRAITLNTHRSRMISEFPAYLHQSSEKFCC